MTEEEISEDLELQFGKPKNVTEQNVRWLKQMLEERVVDGEFDEDVKEPSLDAVALTIIAIYNYPEKTFEELASKKPAIKRTLVYIVVKSNGHYDEIDDLMRRLVKTSHKGLTLVMINKVFNMFRWLASQTHPTKFIEVVLHPEHYDAISNGLHQLIDDNKGENAALYIICAIEDGLIAANASRSIIISEFNQTKSGFNKYFTKYNDDKKYEEEKSNAKIWLNNQKAKRKASLRSTIGYTICSDGEIRFFKHSLTPRGILMYVVSWTRRFFSDFVATLPSHT